MPAPACGGCNTCCITNASTLPGSQNRRCPEGSIPCCPAGTMSIFGTGLPLSWINFFVIFLGYRNHDNSSNYIITGSICILSKSLVFLLYSLITEYSVMKLWQVKNQILNCRTPRWPYEGSIDMKESGKHTHTHTHTHPFPTVWRNSFVNLIQQLRLFYGTMKEFWRALRQTTRSSLCPRSPRSCYGTLIPTVRPVAQQPITVAAATV
jgi:hypothetical protein